MDAKTWMTDTLPKILEKHPERGKEIDANFLFKIVGDNGGTWLVDLKGDPPAVKEGEAEADCTIEMEAEDFEAMTEDFQVAMQMYFQGKLKVSGDPMLATKLQGLFAE